MTTGPLRWAMREQTGATPELVLSGSFTEASDFAGLAAAMPDDVILDVSGIEHINSSGVRLWTNTLRQMKERGVRMSFTRCSVMFMAQVSMIADFTAGFPVQSFLARFVCGDCDEWEDIPVVSGPGARAVLESEQGCKSCGGAMEFDDLVDSYVAVIGG